MGGSLRCCAVTLICTLAVTAAAWADEGEINFARDVQPILADNCYFCHGPDGNQRKADLRLDALDPKLGPFAARDGYSIIAPKNLDDSVLIMRITSDDPDVKMPPPAANRHVTDKQIETIKRWIEQGAKWGKHWAFEPAVRPLPPEVKNKEWPRNAIDRFLLARLEKEGLQPSAPAEKETLIRRVTLDLTGLPPTLSEVEGFLADPSSDAYEKVVDRLLASPRYGERMAWEWLDLARYADTNGYQADPTRTMWPWRDWVIKALNENLPFDQFATWQLAGDLIPNSTRDQKLASGFNRNHPYNGEGGRIAEETRVENVMDRAETTATAFMGLTVGCARCHDHKYDPISQKEYYSLFAYFNQCSETGALIYTNMGNVAPVIEYATDAQTKKLGELKQLVSAAEKRLNDELPKIDAQQGTWEQSARYEKGWMVATPLSAISTSGATLKTLGDSSVLASGSSPATDIHEIVIKPDLSRVTAIRIEALPDPSLPVGGPGRADSGNFVLSNIDVIDGAKTSFSTADATFAQEGFPAANAIDGDTKKTGWAVHQAPDKSNLSAIFRFAEPAKIDDGGELRFRLQYEWPTMRQHTMGRFRISVTDGAASTPVVAAALALAPADRSEEQSKQLRDFYRTRVSPDYRKLSDAVAAARKSAEDFEKKLTKVMVMDDASPRETHVLIKGAYDKPSDKVSTGVLAVLPALHVETSAANNRLALAKWIFDSANPLTARVTVNRYWQQFFGVGIVKTVDDFGAQGERPVHPELLDWLAVQFRESGWDVKALHRLIVTSAAYRQSSRVTPELYERDPENRLLARGPRYRLPSMVIRDAALASSGLLVEKIGGPAVKPYQPPGVWEEATFGFIKYEQDHGEALYRRSIYVFWRRIVGPTEFFDTPSRSVCSVRPSRTNTPLHALTTLNDPTFIEAARCLAQRVMTGAKSSSERLELACRLVLSREPREKELEVLRRALDRLEMGYQRDKPAAAKLLAIGESKRDEKLDPAEHAAYTAVCLEILNLDEALTKE